MIGTMTALVLACAMTVSNAAETPAPVDGGYLFVTFKGEATPLSEQIHFGLSTDGRRWGALNAAKPVLVSALGEKGVRDPFVLRAPDGLFYLLATDLSINRNHDWGRATKRGSKSIVIWESADLVTWSEPRLVAVAAPDAGCTWAPEAVFDAEQGDYLVFWASMNQRDQFAKQRIWACRTKDFKTFGEPFIYIEKSGHVIDTTIIHDGASYYRFTKDESFKAITQECAHTLQGPWDSVPGFSLAKMVGYEGPTCFRLGDGADGTKGAWCLLLDHYAKGLGYEPFVTADLGTGAFTAAPGFSFPFRFRHGTVLRVSAVEYQRLVQAYGTPVFAR